MFADFNALAVELGGDQTSLLRAEPFGLRDVIIETEQDDKSERRARDAAGDEKPLPTREITHTIQIVQD